MGGIIGDITGAVSDVFGGGDSSGGGDFLSELMSMFGGSGSGGGNSTMGEVGQIAGDVLPLLACFL